MYGFVFIKKDMKRRIIKIKLKKERKLIRYAGIPLTNCPGLNPNNLNGIRTTNGIVKIPYFFRIDGLVTGIIVNYP